MPLVAIGRYAVALAESDMPRMSRSLESRFLAALGDSARGQAAIGRLFHEAGDPDRARVHLETAIRLGVSDASSLYLLGLACEEQGDLAAARAAYENYLALDDLEHTTEVTARLRALIEKQSRPFGN
jgi:tetratricopeptide (TPR) repeat protein